jgi:uncharacterized membrane protein
MMRQKIKTSLFAVFAVLAVVTLFGLVSAVPVCTGTLCMSLVNAPTTATHNSDVEVTFNVTYEGAAASTTLDFSTSTGDWKSLPSASTSINQLETKVFKAVLRVPKHSSGSVAGTLNVVATTGGSASLVVPTITITDTPELTLEQTQVLTQAQKGIVKITNDGNVDLDLRILEETSLGVTFSKGTISNLAPGSSDNVDVILPGSVNLKFGNNVVRVKVEDVTKGVSKTSSFTLLKGFCKAGEAGGNLVISDVKIDNRGEGKDDEWKLIDVIEVEVQVDNDGSDDIKDVFIELGLFDSEGKNQVTDLDFENADEEEIDLGRINDGKDETATFRFRVPADMDDGNYKLAVKAYSDDLKEQNECAHSSGDLSDDIFEDISIDREDDEGKFIAFEDIVVSPGQPTCGERVSVTLDVFNIGDEDQDQVRVKLVNSQLGISESVEIRNDLDEGDDETVNFDFVLPSGLENKGYTFALTADYDYNRGTYRETSDEETRFVIQVGGCTTVSGPGPSVGRIAVIDADLDSDAVAGKELVVRSTITNLLTNQTAFVVRATGYESWSDLDSSSETILNLEPGQSKDVTFRFMVDDDAEGTKRFDIEARSGENVERRTVEVDISGGTRTPGITGFGTFGEGNSLIWVIGIINVILIILIIIVAVRISRR